MAGATELPFVDRPKTAREEAAAIERAKRDAEVEEMRRLRNAAAGGGGVGGGSDNDPTSSSSSSSSSSTTGGHAVVAQQPSRSAQETAADAARRRRDEEIEQLRRLRAGENEETRRRLQEKGGTLIVDMDAWRSEQLGAKNRDRKNVQDARENLRGHGGAATDVDARWREDMRRAKDGDRRNRLEAMGNLQGHRGYYAPRSKDAETDADKDAAHAQAQRDRMEGIARGGGSTTGEDEGAEEEDASSSPPTKKPPGKLRSSVVMFKDADEQIPSTTRDGTSSRKSWDRELSVSFQGDDASRDAAAAATAEVEERGGEGKKAVPVEAPTPPPAEPSKEDASEDAAPAPAAVVDDAPAPAAVVDDAVEPEEEQMVPTETLVPPTYARVDIKFSFGLIVRSHAAEGIVGGENLRDNETLRKCMEGTSKILRMELPTPPDVADLEKRATPSSFRGMFPEAYYDPILEPTVISIEEDEKKEEERGEGGVGGKSKGINKRTLVKASFPVFLREEAESEEGKRVYSRILKETKTTVFKSLRAAVSVGQFR
ncbi:hypothetical protein ACHAW5_008028 [Stephanodiscus triporus]|uniref:Uncharacterized protein n=1 Tax=Stephanodiscus triporus TaxID=2934178 RepID=A0ABD3NG57_9STRA